MGKSIEIPQMKVGIVEGTFQDNAALIKLATLPGRDTLLSQVLGALMTPLYSLTGTLNSNTQKLLYMLQEYKGKGA
jgi:ribosomal protein L10